MIGLAVVILAEVSIIIDLIVMIWTIWIATR